MIIYIGLVVSSFFAVLFIGLGLPLYFKKIGRNYFYGYRISHYAMLDEDIWYAVNQQGGRHLIIMGSLLAGNALFAWLFIGQIKIQGIILNIDALIVLIGFIYSGVRGAHLNNQLAEAKGLKNNLAPKNYYKVS
jgi:hypothetical protein